MRIETSEIEKIAKLARLSMSPEETAMLREQMGAILAYVETLDELDTDGIVPTSHAVPVENAFRPDTSFVSDIITMALNNAPESADSYFRVPPVIE